jgi:hypothetical protein
MELCSFVDPPNCTAHPRAFTRGAMCIHRERVMQPADAKALPLDDPQHAMVVPLQCC